VQAGEMGDSYRVSWLFWRCQTERGTRRRPIGIGSQKQPQQQEKRRQGNCSTTASYKFSISRLAL